VSLDLKWHCFVSHTSVSKNKEAAKSLLVHLSQPSSIEKLVVASGGYDLPAYEKLMTLQVWAEAEPPKGTLYQKRTHFPKATSRVRAVTTKLLTAKDGVDTRQRPMAAFPSNVAPYSICCATGSISARSNTRARSAGGSAIYVASR